VNFNNKIFIPLLTISLFFSACMNEVEAPNPEPEVVLSVAEEPVVEEQIEEIVEVELTPLEMCEKEENRYNLIVNAAKNSKIRILNIKPKYKKCIALKKGKYYIEVTKKGYMKHKEWITLDEDMEYDVQLIELLKNNKQLIKKASQPTNIGYNLKKLEKIIKTTSSLKIKNKAKKRLKLIKEEFDGYSPNSIIGKQNCQGFYPKNLVEDMLTISVDVDYWDSIRWSGSCKNGLMNSRGVIYFISSDDLRVDLKGKMINGFFEGNVYNFSRFPNKQEFIRDSGRDNYKIKLNSYDDFKEYQE